MTLPWMLWVPSGWAKNGGLTEAVSAPKFRNNPLGRFHKNLYLKGPFSGHFNIL